MEYDDPSRRLNLLSGLVFGAILGAGLVLLLRPEEPAAGSSRKVVVGARRVRGALKAGEAEPSPTRKTRKGRPPAPAETATSRARRRFEL